MMLFLLKTTDQPALKNAKLLIVCVAALLSGCEATQRDNFFTQPSQWFERSGEMIQDFSRNLTATGDDQELEALFDQPYIDPLTRYLETNRDRSELKTQLQRVQIERDRRCDVIAARFDRIEVTQASADRFRRGYNYSCPAQVDAYAQRLAESEPSSALQASAEFSQQSDTQDQVLTSARDCYLLTSIKNYSEALLSCRTAAQQQDIRSIANLAQIYFALQRYTDAIIWAKKAADQSPDASLLLGTLYEQGLGVEPNRNIATAWYQQAKAMGHPKADGALLHLQSN